MTSSDPTPAEDHAGTVRTRSELDWRDLESAAFAGHPRVQRALLRAAPTMGEGAAHGRARTLTALVLVLLPVLVAFYVVTGEGRGSRGSFVAADDALPWAGGLVTVATLALLVLVLGILRRVRTGDAGGSPGGLVLLVVLTSLAMLVLIPVGAIRGAGEVPRWGLWLLPMVGHLAVAVLFLAALSSSGRGARSPRSPAELAEELPEVERQSISVDLQRAIADLARRGVITPRQAEAADDAELGELTLTMAARAAKASRQRGKR